MHHPEESPQNTILREYVPVDRLRARTWPHLLIRQDASIKTQLRIQHISPPASLKEWELGMGCPAPQAHTDPRSQHHPGSPTSRSRRRHDTIEHDKALGRLR